MKPKTLFTALFLAAGLFLMPFKAYANGCTDICGPDGGCNNRCLRVIQSMLMDIDTQVCQGYLKQGGNDAAAACHNAVSQAAGRMFKN